MFIVRKCDIVKSKSKLIISISGIIIVTLALIGITYGYYQTKVTGNPTGKSIEVVTGNVAVTYTDLTENDVSEIITPGYEHIKLFTVQNTGNVEAKYSIALMDVINTFNRTQDITYTLYRNVGNNTINTTTLANYETVASGIFPTSNAVIKVDEIITTPNSYYTYALKINYVNSAENQNEDQGKTFSGKVQILATDNLDDYNPFDAGTFAYKIFDNGADVLLTSGTTVNKKYSSTTPDFSKVADGSDESNVGLFSIDDVQGTSYYFRGPVKNNYVNFAGYCWRIVRIDGDGSVRLALASSSGVCTEENLDSTSAVLRDDDKNVLYNWFDLSFEYNYDGEEVIFNDNQSLSTPKRFVDGGNIKGYIVTYDSQYGNYGEEGFSKNYTAMDSTITSKLKSEQICLGEITTKYKYGTYSNYFESYGRLAVDFSPSLECPVNSKKTTTTNVFYLTGDELVLAGAKYYNSNNNFYLIENMNGIYTDRGIFTTTFINGGIDNYGELLYLWQNGSINNSLIDATNWYPMRPVISVLDTVIYNSGNGTLESPYEIS